MQARSLRPSLWVSRVRESVGRSRRLPRQGDASSILIWRMQPTVNKVHSLQRPSISSGSSRTQQHPSPHRQQGAALIDSVNFVNCVLAWKTSTSLFSSPSWTVLNQDRGDCKLPPGIRNVVGTQAEATRQGCHH